MNENKEFQGWSILENALREAKQEKTPDLTLDLPHGQKIIIGRLSPDTVLEIATWKGLGRPDESAIRMLLGANMPHASAALPNQPVPPRATETFEIDQTNNVENFSRSERVASMRPRRKSNALRNWLVGILASIALTAPTVFGLAASQTALIIHPQVGPALPIGDATTSLVLVTPKSEMAPGELAIVNIDGKSNLVRVEAVKDSTLLIQTMSGQVQLEREQMVGKVSFIVPFIGAVWLPFHN